jgi:LysR family glycine cleavage system transcriptional activator
MKTPVYLNALRAFEASARHQSFSAAAAELNVTPAAVGQLVRTLEEWLGAPLFHRAAGGRARLVPSEAAERALPDIRAGFERLSLGLERLGRLAQRGADGHRQSGLRCQVAVATHRPFPVGLSGYRRAARYQSQGGGFAAQRIDIGVRYGLGSWPGLIAEKLMEEEVYPVCSPGAAFCRAVEKAGRLGAGNADP